MDYICPDIFFLCVGQKKRMAMGKAEIGKNAGRIWHALNEVHEISIAELAKLLGLPENMVALSVGWLARENKVMFSEREGETKVSNCECLSFAFG